jgi:hypothetical protein
MVSESDRADDARFDALEAAAPVLGVSDEAGGDVVAEVLFGVAALFVSFAVRVFTAVTAEAGDDAVGTALDGADGDDTDTAEEGVIASTTTTLFSSTIGTTGGTAVIVPFEECN